MRRQPLILEELSPDDSEPWLVAEHGEAYDGPRWKRKVLFIHGWFKTEDEARAAAHRIEHP